MRFVRRASLVFSLGLIVAIAVGFVARTSELSSERDQSLSTASELGAAHLSSVVDAAELTARAGSDPAVIAETFASVHPDFGVCAVDAFVIACAGNGPMPSDELRDEEQARRAARPADREPSTLVTVYDSLTTITAVGIDATVFASASAQVPAVESAHSVWVTTLLPAGVSVGEFAVDHGVRQTSAPVEAAAGVYVVAGGDDAVDLPTDEERFYLIILSLAVVLMLLAGVTILVEQRNLQERASFDPLTKLPNRGEFERRAAELLANAQRNESGVCLLLIDLNRFKQVNDTHGHRAGDDMLKIVGSRLRKAVRDVDEVARWGGDEFVVMMPGIATEEMGGRRARQLAEQVGGRTRLDGVADSLRVNVSAGVALWPDSGSDLQALVVAADQAMYEAKREGVTCRVAPAVPEVSSLADAHR